MSTQNVPAPVFTASATIVGFLLIDDLSPAEQNALGNWFMLLAQVLCTNAAQQQVINNKNNQNSQNSHIVNDDTKTSNVRLLEKTITAMQNEINNLKNSIK